MITKNRIVRFRHSLLVLLSTGALVASCKHPDPIVSSSPAEGSSISAEPTGVAAFSRYPKYADAQISPNGTYLGVVVVDRGRRSLGFINLVSRQFSSGLTPDLGAMVNRFHWANDERAVVEVIEEDPISAMPVSFGELYATNAKGHATDRIFSRYRNYEWARVIGRIRKDDHHILIETRSMREAGDRYVHVYRLNIYGERSSVHAGKEHITQSPIPEAEFLTDENGEVRIAWGFDEEMHPKGFFRDPGGGWRELVNLGVLSAQSEPEAFVAGDRAIYISEPVGEGIGLFEVNIDSGQRKLVSKNEFVSPYKLIRDLPTGRIIAVEYEPDVPTYDFLVPDHPICRTLRGLLAAYPDDHVELINRTVDDKKAVAWVYSDRNPGQLLLVDVETMSAEPIVSVRPWIRPEEMAPKSALHLNASDGLRIHAYLTLPRATDPGKIPPLVVLPHGGPHGIRDHWGFDPEVQLLASEGFAVLQVNYRGSGGYGVAYIEAGYGKWGDRVMEDILDATRHVIHKGLVDPTRVCIYGASFGGYAALQSAVLAPDLFRCAVGYAGIYDLTLMDNTGDIHLSSLGRGYVHTAVGKDASALKSASPVYNAEKIQARVFLIHGKKDIRAPFEHAELLKESLTKNGKPPEWLVEPKEMHGFHEEGARERMYTRLLRFLKENTKPSQPLRADTSPKSN